MQYKWYSNAVIMKTFHLQFDRCYIIQHLYIRSEREEVEVFVLFLASVYMLCMQVTRIHVLLSLFNVGLCACVQNVDNLPRQ